MSTGWVAGSVRAKAFIRRRLGRAGVRALARSPSLDTALVTLAGTPYGHDVRTDQTLAEAQHAVAAALLWNLRVLAGWLPREGSDAVRVLAGWFEIANVDELLRANAGGAAFPPYRLGTLATAWPQLSLAESPADLREALARTPWGDPGGESAWELQLGLRLAWADRVTAEVPQAARWAGGGAALLLARETAGQQQHGRRLPEGLAAVSGRLVGAGAAAGGRIEDLAVAAPPTARWALEGVRSTEDLWAAETRWWRAVEAAALPLARSPRFGLEPVLGAVALLAVDAWRVSAALALASRGGGPPEVLDAVA